MLISYFSSRTAHRFADLHEITPNQFHQQEHRKFASDEREE
tara:strand:- start:73 stop:195 length:123 start_codon:yes stop_codon:yes gene_type:complete